MTSYKVTYFQSRGGAEIIRLTLVVGGQEFTDERLSKEEWPEYRDKTPMKAMPLLTVTKDGKDTLYCQSGSISKYLARKFGLYGDNDEETLLIDEVYESIQDTVRDFYKVYIAPIEMKQEAMENFKEKSVPKLAAYFALRKKAYGKDGYIIGCKMTLADIAFFNFVDGTSRMGYGEAWSTFDDIKEHSEKVSANEKIAAWLEKRPESQY